jgi:hypothetical protein
LYWLLCRTIFLRTSFTSVIETSSSVFCLLDTQDKSVVINSNLCYIYSALLTAGWMLLSAVNLLRIVPSSFTRQPHTTT